MMLLKLVFIVFVAAVVVLVSTYAWIVAQSGGAKATSLNAISAMTIHSPFYWALVAAILASIWWLSRRWLF